MKGLVLIMTNWVEIGKRIRKQREFLGYTREGFAEKLDVTPKFCSDIELGIKGMSISTLCKISDVLHLSTDYILLGKSASPVESACISMLQSCPKEKLCYLEDIIKSYLNAIEEN